VGITGSGKESGNARWYVSPGGKRRAARRHHRSYQVARLEWVWEVVLERNGFVMMKSRVMGSRAYELLFT